MISVEKFIAKAEEIAAEEPTYLSGHSGTDGYCDCIGLIIGAIQRAGGQWRGLHGSNYTARREVIKLEPVTGTGDLQTGEVVFKSYEPAQGGNDLPSRYEPGGEYYNGDLRDYYHIGIVESVYPLRIRHMTTPKPKMDTSIGKWSFHAKLKKIDYSGGGEGIVEKVTISGGNVEKPINMRKAASTGSKLIAEIPQGSEAELLEAGGVWNQIQYGNLTGYVKSEFVHRSDDEGGGGGDGGETVTINRADLEKVLYKIETWLGLNVG